MDLDAIFDGKDQAPEPAPQPAEIPVPEQAPEPAPEPEAPPEPPAPKAEEQDRTVPLSAVLDERDRRKAAERERDELRAAAQQRQPTATPDPYDDPTGYDQAVEARIIMGQLKMSKAIAMKDHGAEAVESALAWAAEQASRDDSFERRMIAQDHPIEWVVRQQKQEADLSEYSKDPVAFARRILEANGQLPAPDAGTGAPPVPGQQPAPKPATPPRSIAGNPSAGGNREVALDGKAAMDAIFTR